MRGKCVVVVVSSYWHNTLLWRTGNFLFVYIIFKYSPIVPGSGTKFFTHRSLLQNSKDRPLVKKHGTV